METTELLIKTVLNLARDFGATTPTIAEASGDFAVVLDTDSGRTWKIELREF